MVMCLTPLYNDPAVPAAVALASGVGCMNRTRIQYAIIAHRELTEAKRRIASLETQLTQRLATLDTEERSAYRDRTRAIPGDLLGNG